jgi:endonuclease G, mitochondrial
MRIRFVKTIIIFSLCVIAWNTQAQKTSNEFTAKERELYAEHIVQGQPDGSKPVYVRQGYVVRYSEKYRIPEWTAYHVTPAYLKCPKREGRFRIFRKDPEIKNAVVTEDYTGSGYARGHMAPYFVMGGDRDRNGVFANAEIDAEDPYDDRTVFEANYMSNISPQDQDALNGPGGPWYALETAIRKKLVTKHKMDLHVYAGSIILDPDHYFVMHNKKGTTDIAIPDEFFQVIIYYDKDKARYITAAFLFPHKEDPEDLPFNELLDYLVTVDAVEKKTGLDFLNTLSKPEQQATESNPNFEFWDKLMND